jgi:hypothetical protein
MDTRLTDVAYIPSTTVLVVVVLAEPTSPTVEELAEESHVTPSRRRPSRNNLVISLFIIIFAE